MGIGTKLKHAWNAFSVVDDDRMATAVRSGGDFVIGSSRPDRVRVGFSNDRSMIGAIYTRLATDFASISIRHVRLDDNGRFSEEIDSGLNNCLKLEANLDQGARSLKQDIAMTLFEHGYLAIEVRFLDEGVAPDLHQQTVFFDQVSGVFHQDAQEIEDLRSQRDRPAVTSQTVLGEVQTEPAELIDCC